MVNPLVEDQTNPFLRNNTLDVVQTNDMKTIEDLVGQVLGFVEQFINMDLRPQQLFVVLFFVFRNSGRILSKGTLRI